MATVSEKLARKRVVAKTVLSTPEGQEFYENLKNEFFSGPATLRGRDANETAFNLGRLDVLAYIEQLLKKEE